jgi:outer membrane receptor protein involved in Fe transport
MENAFFGTPEPLLAIPSIGAKTYVDLGLGYEIGDGVVARFGINNVTDTEPPLLAEQGSANNTEPGLFDLFGRSYYLSFSARF